ncbi:MAG TPA: hypothetical protein VIG64_08465, partial [Actinomycetota bacterium]
SAAKTTLARFGALTYILEKPLNPLASRAKPVLTDHGMADQREHLALRRIDSPRRDRDGARRPRWRR